VEDVLPRPTVIVADDNGLVLAKTRSCLQPNFEVVGTVSNGRDLLCEAERLKPDIVVLDITMPILNGIEAAHQLRERGSTAKIVFLTVHTGSSFVDACFAEGALGYVTKARLRADLVRAMNEVLSGHKFVSP
jgi:DNA-binding NarL/FixJ family response regulator